MSPYPDIPSEAFAKRLANLLVDTRVRDGQSLGALSRRSHGAFTRNQLRAYESGTYLFGDGVPEQLSLLYGCDLAAILPERTPIMIEAGTLSVGGVARSFEADNPQSLMREYLLLVRALRRQEAAPEVPLRRDDVEVIARHVGSAHEAVVATLTSLMGSTQSKRVAMVGLLATSVAVLGLVGTAAALGSTDDAPPATTMVATTVVEATSTTGVAPDSTPAPTSTNGATTTIVVTTSTSTTVAVTVPAIVGTDVTLPSTTSTLIDGGPPPVP